MGRPGKNTLVILLSCICLLTLNACQIYRNSSRNLFEQNAPSRIVNTDIGSKSIHIHSCWSQAKTDVLAELPENQFPDQYFYTIQETLDTQTIEVCLAENIHLS